MPLSRRRALAQLSGATLLAGAAPLLLAAPRPAPPAANNFSYALNVSTVREQKLGFIKELELAARAGYGGVEIWINGFQDYLAGGGTTAEVRRRLADLNLRVENAIGFAAWIVDDEATRRRGLDQARREMEQLAQIGCHRMAAPPFGAHQPDAALLDLRRAAERYRALLEVGAQAGVTPQLEVWGFSPNLSRLGETLFVAAESGHPDARILPDVYHLYRGGSGFGGLHLVSGQAIEVFHLNDYPAQPAAAQLDDSQRVYPGDGVAPLTPLLRGLQQAGGPKVLSLELFNPGYWKQDALTVAKTGLARMKAAVARALEG